MTDTRKAMHSIEQFMGQYWDIAYDEGKNGVNRADDANKVLSGFRKALRTELERVQDTCTHRTITQYTGDGTPVEFCPECGTNRLASGAAPQPVQEPNGWLPIETAPIREKCLLLGKVGPFIGMWGEYNLYNQPNVTHWMPLPLAPRGTV